MQIIYDIIIFLFFLVYLPYFLFRRKINKDFFVRLGFIPQELKKHLKDKSVIWLHAVSVGELIAARSFIEELKKEFPDKILLISTVTLTANNLAKSIYTPDIIIYSPIDFSFIVKKFVRIISPCLYLCMETEIWPNIMLALKRNNIPIIIINGRISDKSFKGYKKIKFILKNILNKIDIFSMQTMRDQERIINLGIDKNKVIITGNMKFDLNYSDIQKPLDLKSNLGEIIFIAGSTHPQEEEIILDIYNNLKKEFNTLKLILAPRHIERIKNLERLIKSYNLSYERLSKFSTFLKSDICLVDTIGQLSNLYKIADIVFVGGSLVKRGGHNIIEPAYFAKPILFGNFMFNFRDIADLFLEESAAICIKNKEEFLEKMKFLLKNPKERSLLGERALKLIEKNRGATKRNLELVRKFIE